MEPSPSNEPIYVPDINVGDIPQKTVNEPIKEGKKLSKEAFIEWMFNARQPFAPNEVSEPASGADETFRAFQIGGPGGNSATTAGITSIPIQEVPQPNQHPVIDEGEVKPPLGLKPKWLHDEHRANEIQSAMSRYIDDAKQIPAEWIEEFAELTKQHPSPQASKEEVEVKVRRQAHRIISALKEEIARLKAQVGTNPVKNNQL